ncbi:hypothetical protein PR048_010041 [Dryococelus australis]|uniref:F-box domain-containing protein n=1 Tax=Dryococelus australis TaxID=614101 RepID=A0ABQ9I1Q4_9NEOP|nr:hypothetical protein PR048_010041 [Dryococelus australis]
MSSIMTLPPEVLMEIFSYLPPQELLDNIQQVCCAWRKLVRHLSLWEHFVYFADSDTKVEEVVGFIEKCPMLKHIDTCYLKHIYSRPTRADHCSRRKLF